MNFFGLPGTYQQPSTNNDMDCIIEPIVGVGGLYIGNLSAATNLEGLMYNGIRCILTAAQEANFNHSKESIPYHIKFPALDYEGFALNEYFDQAADYLDQHLSITNVLVHCMAGVSRSVSLVIAYLMKYRGMRFEDALNLIRSRRPVANPNPGFVHQLKKYHHAVKGLGKMYAQRQPHVNYQMQGGLSPNRAHSPSPNPTHQGGYYNPEERNGGLKGSQAGGMYMVPQPVYPASGNNLRGSFAGQTYPDLSMSWNPGFGGYRQY